MLEGWYCRTLANEQSNANVSQQNDTNIDVNGDDSDSEESFVRDGPGEPGNNGIDYKSQYRYLKRKLKFLIYENEFFQDALRINQRRLLKVSRDRSFLLDRLLQYEKPENTSSESEDTESSEDEATKEAKKRKFDENPDSNTATAKGRKKKIGNVPQTQTKLSSNHVSIEKPPFNTPARVEDERADVSHVEMQQLQPIVPPIPNRPVEAAPNNMFNNDRTLESDSNDHIMDDSSPSHVAAEECVPMEYSNN